MAENSLKHYLTIINADRPKWRKYLLPIFKGYLPAASGCLLQIQS